jgi:hypothetical protein
MNPEINFINQYNENRNIDKKLKIQNIEQYEDPNFKPYKVCTAFGEGSYSITIYMIDNLYEVGFRASESDDLYIFFDTLRASEFKDFIVSLSISQPDEQQNGCFTYDLGGLIENVVYKNLKALNIQQYYGNNNIPELSGNGDIYKKLLIAMPNLIRLCLPNSPMENFFKVDYHPLKSLDVQLFYYENQNFIVNLTNYTIFYQLEFLRITEAFEDLWTGGDNISNDEYLSFFGKANYPNLKTIDLRNVTFNIDFFNQLKQTKLGKQLNNFTCSYGGLDDAGMNMQFNLETNQHLQVMWQDGRDWGNQKYD